MNMTNRRSFSLADAINEWLSVKESQAARGRDVALKMFHTSHNVQTYGQLRYFTNACKAIKWLRKQIPLRFRDVIIYNQMDQWADDDFIEKLIGGK